MRRTAGRTFSLILALALGACGPGRGASELTHPLPRGGFPLYATVPGTAPATGSVFRIEAPTEAGGPFVMSAVATGLDFPAGLAVDRKGSVYVAERPTASTGRVLRLAAGRATTAAPAVVAGTEGLADPEGLAFDDEGRLHVIEAGRGRLVRIGANGSLTTVADGLASPRSLAVGDDGAFYVAETASASVTRIGRGGAKTTVASGLANPVAAAPALIGGVFGLVAASGLADGRALQLTGSGAGATYLEGLVNPTAFGWEDGSVLYVAEGVPALRLIRYAGSTDMLTEIAAFPGEVQALAFTPEK